MGATGGITEPSIAFRVRDREEPALAVRVNFGLFAGRNATQAEIDDLARTLHSDIEAFAIVAEERHEFGGDSEASLRQVLIEVTPEHVGDDIDATCELIVAAAEEWARACIASRSELGELSD
jgi:hypothetical protein